MYYYVGAGLPQGVASLSGPPRQAPLEMHAFVLWVRKSGSFFHPQPPSLLILLSEPGSERKVLTKET